MEEILRKLFYKWFVYEVGNYEGREEMRSFMNQQEKVDYSKEIETEIDKHITETINQIKDSLDDASADIEFNFNIKLDQLKEDNDDYLSTNSDPQNIGDGIGDDVEDGWEVDIEENEKFVICSSNFICRQKECKHIVPHIYNEVDCKSYCGFRSAVDYCIECEKPDEKLTFKQDERFGKVVICTESKDCNFKDCMHIKPHIFNEGCIGECANKTEHKDIECE